jgi:hypothetical protein
MYSYAKYRVILALKVFKRAILNDIKDPFDGRVTNMKTMLEWYGAYGGREEVYVQARSRNRLRIDTDMQIYKNRVETWTLTRIF